MELSAIRTYRQQQGYSQAKLAELTGLHLQTVKDHEARRYVPSAKALVDYARIFGDTPEQRWAVCCKIGLDRTLMAPTKGEVLDYIKSVRLAPRVVGQ